METEGAQDVCIPPEKNNERADRTPTEKTNDSRGLSSDPNRNGTIGIQISVWR